MILDFHSYLFPVFGGSFEEDDNSLVTLFGTASNFGGKYFITAGHVIKAAVEKGDLRIGIKDPESPGIFTEEIVDYEIINELDLSIFSIHKEINNISAFPINMRCLDMLDDVAAGGFPHSFDGRTGLIRPRSFKGYIVNYGPLHQFPANPKSYELSFQCPKGISGAPLLKFDPVQNSFNSHGYIVGNTNTEITVFSETEINDDGSQKVVYQKTESTKFGIAIESDELRNYQSKLVGDIFDYLFRKHLLV